MRIRVGDPSISWSALRPQSDIKQVLITEEGTARLVGKTTEEILSAEVDGRPALRRTQVLQSDELESVRAETIVLRDGFRPFSHSVITETWTLSITYRGTSVIGEKRGTSGGDTPIEAELESPVFDSHSVEMVLRVLPLAHNYTAEVPAFHGVRGVEMLVVAHVLACETLTSSGQSLHAWKVETDWGGVTQYYWIGTHSRQLFKQSSELADGVQLEFVRC